MGNSELLFSSSMVRSGPVQPVSGQWYVRLSTSSSQFSWEGPGQVVQAFFVKYLIGPERQALWDILEPTSFEVLCMTPSHLVQEATVSLD